MRIRVKVRTDAETAVFLNKLVFVGGMERARGVGYVRYIFLGSSRLRRLLTDYGFDGHPLRKDFPLTGYVEVRYMMNKRE